MLRTQKAMQVDTGFEREGKKGDQHGCQKACGKKQDKTHYQNKTKQDSRGGL